MSIFPPSREQRKGTLHLPSQMRVIAGLAGGIRLKIPPHDLRPTMDMVREAAFSSLAELVADARVLDLFAGSGAYGIEALSRGAGDAIFVDDHPKSIETIRFNLLHTKLSGKVVRSDVFRFSRNRTNGIGLCLPIRPILKRPEIEITSET
jgi:16S rRNA (guanine(966)-N(2))-methyltransferase RsmD